MGHETLTLYHGSNAAFERVDLAQSKDRRDFGRGFYMTTVREQARTWADIMFARHGGEGRYVYTFRFEIASELKVKTYDSLSGEWLEMVKNNRLHGGVCHDFDVVMGPVANDNTMRTVSLYVEGIYTAAQAIEQLRFFRANDQVSIHTGKALAWLTLTGAERLEQ
jgi:hypothetical protein